MPSRKKKYTKKRLAKRLHRITPEKLAEALPDVVQRLEQNNDKEDVDEVYGELFSSLGIAPGKTVLTKQGITMGRLEFRFMVLAGLAAVGDGEKVEELKTSMKASIAIAYCALFDKYAPDENASINRKIKAEASHCKACFDTAVDEHKEDIIATCYQGNAGKFIANCEAYATSDIDEFVDIFGKACTAIEDLDTGGENAMFERLQAACVGVQCGTHKSTWVCWHCGAEANKRCSGCRCAKYCSKECQLLHWKAGHRSTCTDTKSIFAPFELDLATLDAALGDIEGHEKSIGVAPTVADLHVMRLACLNHIQKYGYSMHHEEGMKTLAIAETILDLHFPGTKGLNGPSMAKFYSNVKHVVEDGFLMTPTPTTSKVNPIECIRDEGRFMAISRALMFDYSRLPREDQMGLFWELANVESSDGENAYMPPQEWLFNYCDGERYLEEGPACKKFYVQTHRKTVDLNFNDFLRTHQPKIQSSFVACGMGQGLHEI